MAYNRKILARARARLADRREANRTQQQLRLKTVYSRVPEIEQTDNEILQNMCGIARSLSLEGSAFADAAGQIRAKNRALQDKKKSLLLSNGFPADWLDEIFTCPKCKDSGNDGGGICSCLEKLYNEELTAELSSLLKTGDESFEKFNLTLYPVKNREHMAKVKSLCEEFVQYFPDVGNLLLSGPPGLGKTFLSACMARELAGRGYSIVYDTAINCLSLFEKQQFSRDAEQEAAASAVRSMLNCDLMILDDLGSEFATPAVVSALYNLINTRINNRKITVINTNLSTRELEKRYTPAICSRIEGCYSVLSFEGDDIRKLLKEN